MNTPDYDAQARSVLRRIVAYARATNGMSEFVDATTLEDEGRRGLTDAEYEAIDLAIDAILEHAE